MRVAPSREAGVTLPQIASNFGIYTVTLSNWISQAAIDDGDMPGASSTDAAEHRELRLWVDLLEQENEILRRSAACLSQANLMYPLVSELADDGVPVIGDVSGTQDRSPALRPMARRSGL